MVFVFPDEIKMDGKYPIGEAARLMDMHRSTLLRKIQEGAIKCGNRKDNGRKFLYGRELRRYFDAVYY